MQYIFFDTETTGLDAKTDRIIEIAAISSENAWMDAFVNLPEGYVLPEMITELTGITDETLKDKGMPETEALSLFFDLFDREDEVVLVAHNAQFDLNFLKEAVSRYPEMPIWSKLLEKADYLDTLTVYSDRRNGRHRLCDAIEAYGLENVCKNSHRAIDDVVALKKVFWKLMEERKDVADYINVFAVNPKYGINGEKIEKVRYGTIPERESDMAEVTLPMIA